MSSDDSKEKSASASQLQQSSERKYETNHKDQRKYEKDCDHAKINKLLGYCPQNLSGKNPADVRTRGNRPQEKLSHPAQSNRDFTTKNVEKKPTSDGTLSHNKPVKDPVQKRGNSHIQHQAYNNSEKKESDENANSLTSSISLKSELSRGNITDSGEIKDTLQSSNRCQENLPSNSENKKNKKGRIVSSRYMRTAKPVNKPTSQATSNIPNSGKTKRMITNNKKVERVNLNSTPAILNDDGLSLPDNNKNNQVTSTPAIHALPFSHEMSSIMADASIANFGMKMILGPQVERNKMKLHSCIQETAMQRLAVPPDLPSVKSAFSSPLEVMYCRYLQAVFLEAKSAETLKKKSQNAKQQLFHLWEKNQELLEINANLDLEIASLENLQHVNFHLDSQEKHMESLNEIIEKLDCEYKNTAKALDTTRHQLPTSGIFLCDINDLSDTLKETEKLSELLVTTMKPHQESLVDLESNLSKIEETVQVQKKELHRCLDLTKRAESLTAQESSLQIQSIQKNIQQRKGDASTENCIL